MKNNFCNNEILYYPRIEFYDETWVKTSLLFWDRIYRIVPQTYEPKDSEEIQIAKTEGFICDINLSENDLKETAIDFEKYCEKMEWFPAGFKSSNFDILLHEEKVDSRIQKYFKGIYGEKDRNGFYRLPNQIANGYMFFLSNIVSQRRNIPKLTDNQDMFAAMMYFDGDSDFDEVVYQPESNEFLSNLVIENTVPADIESINIRELLKFITKFEKEKKEFRYIVSDLEHNLSIIEDHDFRLKEIEEFKKRITDNSRTRNAIINDYFKELKSSLLYTGIPTTISSLTSLSVSGNHDPYDLKFIIPGVFIGAIAAFSSASNSIRKNWDSNKSTYYLNIHEFLDSKNCVRIVNMNHLMNEYIND